MRQLGNQIEQIDRQLRHETSLFEHKQAIALERGKMVQKQEAIEPAHAPDVTRFSNLKELVDLKVCNLIDGLPFTPEGYKKAKDLLGRRYGKTSEVVGTYVRNILDLRTVRERDVKKTHEFYEILLFNVESLQTMQSLNKLDAAVRFTFDKLGVIKNELVQKLSRTDLLNDYDAVIREQLEEGVVGQAPAKITGREFYLPHRAVVCKNAETTKLQVM